MKKKLFRTLFLLMIPIFATTSIHATSKSNIRATSDFVIFGNIKNDVLNKLLEDKSTQVHACSKKKKKKKKALIIDGGEVTPDRIQEELLIKEAISTSTPIILSDPTKENTHAIAGIGVNESKLVVIVPKHGGEEFDIHLIHPKKEATYKGCTKKKKKEKEDVKEINRIVESHQVSRNDVNANMPQEWFGCHKRWTLKYSKPFVWGEQRQFIDIGFQYDLYYVKSPKPARKYLVIKTVGKGVGPGTLQHDRTFHRGYYQDKVAIAIDTNYPHNDWKTGPLTLEEMAPRTENGNNEIQVTTGISFGVGGVLGHFEGYPGAGVAGGLQLTRENQKEYEFSDFCVSVDSTPGYEKWTYWMSGAEGKQIRRNRPEDILYFSFIGGALKVSPLPQLAKSVLMPGVEAVYFASGKEDGTRTICSTIEHHLQDIQSPVVPIKELAYKKYASKCLPFAATIDFSKVHEDNHLAGRR